VKQAHEAGITRVWIQQMAQSPEALAYCEENDLSCVSGECILMYAEPVGSIHKFHRFFRKLFGRMPR
jgi:predicted CoA-binding protein